MTTDALLWTLENLLKGESVEPRAEMLMVCDAAEELCYPELPALATALARPGARWNYCHPAIFQMQQLWVWITTTQLVGVCKYYPVPGPPMGNPATGTRERKV